MPERSKRSISSYLIFSVVAIVIGVAVSSFLIRTGVYFYAHINSALFGGEQTASTPNPLTSGQKIASAPKSNLPVSAWAYLAQDIETGEIFAAKNKRLILPIASVTKLMTAAVALDNIPQNTLVTITQSILATPGSGAKFKLNERIKVSDILYPLLMVSSNDASEALARTHGRSVFLSLMNKQAKAWGALNTNFIDPSGLSYENTSTAEDVYKILKAIHGEKPELLDITRLKTKTLRGHTWTNSTHFLNMSSYLGGKNGYTDEAERTNASLFAIKDKNGIEHKVAIINLRSLDRDKDTLTILKYVEGLYNK